MAFPYSEFGPYELEFISNNPKPYTNCERKLLDISDSQKVIKFVCQWRAASTEPHLAVGKKEIVVSSPRFSFFLTRYTFAIYSSTGKTIGTFYIPQVVTDSDPNMLPDSTEVGHLVKRRTEAIAKGLQGIKNRRAHLRLARFEFVQNDLDLSYMEVLSLFLQEEAVTGCILKHRIDYTLIFTETKSGEFVVFFSEYSVIVKWLSGKTIEVVSPNDTPTPAVQIFTVQRSFDLNCKQFKLITTVFLWLPYYNIVRNQSYVEKGKFFSLHGDEFLSYLFIVPPTIE